MRDSKLYKPFENCVAAKMEAEGFILFKRTYGPQYDYMILTYCKYNHPLYTNVTIKESDLSAGVPIEELCAARSTAAIRAYNRGF